MRCDLSRPIVAVVCMLAVGISPVLAQEESDERYRRLLDEKSPAIVIIKSVLKIKAGGEEQEIESESAGVVIDPKGLVLCSNSRLGGAFGLVRRLMGGSLGAFTIIPTNIKVIVGDAAEGLDARFVARDTELDLAWIQIKDPGDQKLVHIDLSRSALPRVGQRVVSIYRMSRNYDHVPVVMETLVGGAARKPREVYLAGDLSAALGLPAFTQDGKVVGLSILQIPDSEGDDSMQRLDRMVNSHEYSGALLPIAEVIRATERARASAQTQTGSDEDGDEAADHADHPANEADNADEETSKSNE